jgi:hypothetical protein
METIDAVSDDKNATPASISPRHTMRARRLWPFWRIIKSNSLGIVAGPEKTILAPSWDRFRTRQSTVEYRLLNAT